MLDLFLSPRPKKPKGRLACRKERWGRAEIEWDGNGNWGVGEKKGQGLPLLPNTPQVLLRLGIHRLYLCFSSCGGAEVLLRLVSSSLVISSSCLSCSSIARAFADSLAVQLPED